MKYQEKVIWLQKKKWRTLWELDKRLRDENIKKNWKKKTEKYWIECVSMFKYCMFKYGIIKKEEYRK